MKNLKRIILTIIIFALKMKGMSAAINSSTGTYSGSFLKLNGGARAAAMGNACIALANDTGAVYWNPAGLTDVLCPEFSSMYMDYVADIKLANFSAVLPTDNFAMGCMLNYQDFGSMQETTALSPAGTGRFFTPSAYDITASLARRIHPFVSVGGSIKYINQNIDSKASSGYGLDLGMLYRITEEYSLGFSARNLIGKLSGAQLAGNYGIGLSYISSPLTVAIDLNLPNDNAATLNVGAEYCFADILFGRIGYNSRTEERAGGNLTAGVGINIGSASFDYAYVPYGDLGTSHRFALSCRFEDWQ